MSARPFMPLYVADYLADTSHLRTIEHGAYLLLICHYWRTGGLPTDDAALARIARMTGAEWRKVRPAIATLFQDGWKHKRIEFELSEAARISAAGRTGGLASAEKRRAKSDSGANDRSTVVENRTNDPATNGQALHSQSQSQKKDAAPVGAQPKTDEADLFDRGRKVLGKDAGGMIAKVLKAKGGNVSLARAAIETAATKSNPREYVGAIIRGGDPPDRTVDPRL